MTWVNRLRGFTRLGSVLVWGLVSGMAHAQFFDPLDGQLDLSDYLSEIAYGFLPVPIVITDPAVDGGLGMMGLFFHETEEEKQNLLREENIHRLNLAKNEGRIWTLKILSPWV